MPEDNQTTYITYKGTEYTTKEVAIEYFYKKYHKSYKYVKSLVDRYGLYNKDIVSIGCGLGAEEIIMADYGKNRVDGIDRDTCSAGICQDFIEKHGVKDFRLFPMDFNDFKEDKKYDVIYTNSPSDWMLMNPDLFIPQNYLDFITKYGKEKAMFIAQIRGGTFNKLKLQDADFRKGLVAKIESNTNYKVKEMWLEKETAEKLNIMVANYDTEIPLVGISDVRDVINDWHEREFGKC